MVLQETAAGGALLVAVNEEAPQPLADQVTLFVPTDDAFYDVEVDFGVRKDLRAYQSAASSTCAPPVPLSFALTCEMPSLQLCSTALLYLLNGWHGLSAVCHPSECESAPLQNRL